MKKLVSVLLSLSLLSLAFSSLAFASDTPRNVFTFVETYIERLIEYENETGEEIKDISDDYFNMKWTVDLIGWNCCAGYVKFSEEDGNVTNFTTTICTLTKDYSENEKELASALIAMSAL